MGLYLFGPLLERAHGCGRFALVFLGGGIAGSLASMLFSRQIGAGASGGMLGVCAALVLIRYRRAAMLPAEVQAICGSQLVAGMGLTLVSGGSYREWITGRTWWSGRGHGCKCVAEASKHCV